MVKKSNFLKNLLTTASVLAVTASAGTAMARDMQNIVGNVATIANVALSAHTATVAAPGVAADFADNDNFFFSSANALNTGGIVTVGTIDLKGFAAGPFTVAHSVDLASVVNIGGAQKLATAVNNGQILKLTGANVSALGAITLASGAGGAGTLDVTANDTTLTGNIDSNVVAANGGVITINATNTIFEGSVGATTKLEQLDITAGKSATLAKTGNNKINDVQIDTGSTLTIGAGVNITSAKIDGVVNNKGTLAFDGASTVAVTTIGNKVNTALEAITIGNGLVDLSTTTDLKATKTTLNGANSAIKFTAVSNSTTDFETAANGEGKITFNADHTATGNFGADGFALNTVEVIGANTLTIEKDAGKLYVNNVTATGNASLDLQGANYEIHANVGKEANKFAEVNLKGNMANVAATFKLMAGKTIHATKVDLANDNNVDNTLELYEGSSIIGNVDTANANKGFISVKGDATVSSIGTNTAINQVKFDEAKTLTVTKNTVNANAGVNFIKDGTLALTEAAALDITKAVTVAKSDANGLGSITVNKATAGQLVKFAQIGDVAVADTSLKLLAATGGTNIELNGTASIIKLDLGSSNAEVRLTDAVAGKYLIKDLAHAEGKGALVLTENVTLKEGTNLGNSLDYIQINNKALTVEDGVNLNTTNGIRSNGAGAGDLIFAGDSTVSGVVGSNNTLNNVTINSANKTKTVDFLNKFNIAGDLKIARADTAILRGEVFAQNIQGNAANQGTVKFFNSTELTGATEVKAAIGAAGNVLDTVVLGGKNITFNHAAVGTFATNNLAFDGKSNELTATFSKLTANALHATTITTNSDIRGHHIVLNDADHTLDKAVGSAANNFGNFKLLTDKTITVNHADFYAGVTRKTDKEGTVTFAAQNGNVVQLGDATNELLAVNFNESITAHAGVYSKTIILAANKQATFKDIVKSSGAMTINAGSHALFDGANTRSEAIIAANAAGDGTVEYNNTTTISAVIGTAALPVNAINFTGTADTHVASVGANLTANNITIGAQTFKPTTDINLSSTTAINGSTLDLDSANVTLANAAASVMTGNVTINTTLANNEIGHLTVDGAASTLNAAATSLTINVTDNEDLPVADQSFTLFDTANAGTVNNIATATVNTTNNFIKWTQNGAQLVRSNNAVAAITAALGNANKELLADAVKYGDANNTGNARAFTTDMSKMSTSQITEALQRVTATTAIQAPKVVAAVEESTNQVISNRMGALSNHPQAEAGKQLADSGVSGVSAGEGDHTMYGAWVSPFYSTATQKELKGTAGFKSNSYGATIGFDTQANADLTVGLAGSYVRTDMKHKNFKSGDKTKADTFLFSIYGIQQLTNEWFLQGHTSFSSSRIKNTEKRIISTGTQTAKGDFDTTSCTAELLAGYNHMMDNAVITPLMGASFTRINDGGYKETGTTNQNLNITRKATNKFEAILGLRAQMTTAMEGIDVTPEVHAFVKHDLVGQDSRVTAKHNGLITQLSPKAAKAQKTTFNVGFGVNAVSGMYEYGAGYDLNVAEKSLGNQGTLKVRLNF